MILAKSPDDVEVTKGHKQETVQVGGSDLWVRNVFPRSATPRNIVENEKYLVCSCEYLGWRQVGSPGEMALYVQGVEPKPVTLSSQSIVMKLVDS